MIKCATPKGKRILRSAKVCQDLKCGHIICKPCIEEYVRRAIFNGKTTFGQLPCPVESCTVPLEDFTIRSLVSAEDGDRHKFFLQQRMIDEDDNVRRCPAPNWGKVFGIAAGATDVECPKCHMVFCVACGLRSHPGSSCETACDAAYGQWKLKKGVKPCPGCRFHTEKNGGCNHVFCSRCLTEWCYDCGNGGARALPSSALSIASEPRSRARSPSFIPRTASACPRGLLGLWCRHHAHKDACHATSNAVGVWSRPTSARLFPDLSHPYSLLAASWSCVQALSLP